MEAFIFPPKPDEALSKQGNDIKAVTSKVVGSADPKQMRSFAQILSDAKETILEIKLNKFNDGETCERIILQRKLVN